jgi:uncharacterized protein
LRPLWLFLAIVFGWSWTAWTIAILWPGELWTWPRVGFIYLGGLGPPLAGILMTAVTGGMSGLRTLAARTADPRRLGAWWWAICLGLVPLVTLAAAVVAFAAGERVEITPSDSIFGLTAFAGFILLFGPLPEEIGWRGFAQDRLVERLSPARASIALGLIWTAWHLPLQAMPGYYGPEGPPEFFGFAVNTVVTSLLIGWVWTNTQRSVLAAILLHASVNFWGELVDGPAIFEAAKTLFWGAAALAVLGWFGGELSRRA